MKKQFLTLGVCLALTATSALACGNAAFDKNVQNAPAKATVKVKPEANKMRDSQKIKQREAKMNKERELLYNALNLTEDQRVQARAIDAKAKLEGAPLMEKFKEEKTELKQLKQEKAKKMAVCKQKREVRKAKKAMKKHMKATKKEFTSILTKDQKAKFRVICKEKKAEMKKMKAMRKECK